MKTNKYYLLFLLVGVFQAMNAQLDYSGQWKIVNQETMDTTIARIFVSKNDMILQTSNKVQYSGVIDGNNEFELNFVYPTMDDVPDLEYAKNPRDPKLLKLYTKDAEPLNPIKFKGVFIPNDSLRLVQIIPQFDGVSLQADEPKEIEYSMLPDNIIYVYDKTGKESGIAANFSNPFPTVIINPNSIDIGSVSENKATIYFEADIRDPLADIVKNKADIKEVYLEYIDPSTEDFIVIQNLQIKKTPENTSKWRPFAHKISVSIPSTSVPLIGKETNINLRVVNALGNTSTASVILVSEEKEPQKDDFLQFYEYSYQSFKHTDAINNGYANPLQISLIKADYIKVPLEEELARDTLIYNNQKLEIYPEKNSNKPNEFYIRTPIMALGFIPDELKDVPNLISPETENDFEINYKDTAKEFYWTYSTNSPYDIYTYAIGLTYKHRVESKMFEKFDVIGIDGIYDLNGNLLINKNAVTVGPEVKGSAGNYSWIKRYFDIKIPKERRLLGKQAILQGVWQKKGTNRIIKGPISTFFISSLKTIIVGVDGFAYDSALAVVNNDDADGFKSAFNSGFRDKALKQPVLSAIPTVTWCNWTGIYSGQRPGEHGINGNSYLGFNSQGEVSGVVNASAVIGGFNNRARNNAGSLYDNLITDYPNGSNNPKSLNIISLYPWYSYSKNDNATVTSIGYSKNVIDDLKKVAKESYYIPGLTIRKTYDKDIVLKQHNPLAARRLDLETSAMFLSNVSENLKYDSENLVDFVSLYYPGPDNVAHHIGNKEPEDIKEAYDFEQDLVGVRYHKGPALPNVADPLLAIQEHALQVTNYYFKKVTDFLFHNGLLYSTMFVLIADHGLHAYHNDEHPSDREDTKLNQFNIFPKDILDAVKLRSRNFLLDDKRFDKYIEEMDRRKVRGEKDLDDFLDSDVYTYSPNGGMGHLYIRTALPYMDNLLALESAKALFLASTGKGDVNLDNTKLGPKNRNPSKQESFEKDHGAFGRFPAIFVKACQNDDCSVDGEDYLENRMLARYRWVESVDPANGEIKLNSINAFLMKSGHMEDWPDFEARLEEMNDPMWNSRSGDVVVFTDGEMGYLTVNEGDQMNGWHGGATISESFIPMFINIPGNVADESFIRDAFRKVESTWKSKTETRPNSEFLRNWHLSEVLSEIYKNIE
ncbi:alkaline phosphatase family protein [Spongiimicrobium sp. 3-5]|uniref:alkaline phosphatase family protein n=1 Tax=Spongiimicrobium sp. 3-5 TaxID=3332596 RepID=UPI00397F4CC7